MRDSKIMFSNLRAEMAREEITIGKIAEKVGVNRDTMGRKLSGKAPLYLNEAFVINRIFFPKENIQYLFKELIADKSDEEKLNLKN
ncbi:XRE family transcriptional regulator [Clostridium algidicarnis]|uniref:XRE family transcriptional regulator n=1 Tax=Clostridium algidicarnis TaxID=37659 RepID=UPI001C0DD2A8|nr:XRE family transcriptional regulator [Clostridium algidicarnis]MBU3205186.1 XRE family transcriptional regulator [Clostridium algidicarnis]MBU3213339.1 XRE family transcriptional regulator [Clostridium algidicarnis]MBU3223766.1 XRE family transcriptional regulator [Clostridium algidicarnis]